MKRSFIGLVLLAVLPLGAAPAYAGPIIYNVGIFLENAGNGTSGPAILMSASVDPSSPATSITSVVLKRIVTDGSGPWLQPLTFEGGNVWREWDYNPGLPISRVDPIVFAITATDNLGVQTVMNDIIVSAPYDLDPLQNFRVTPEASGFRVALDTVPGAAGYSYWVWGVPGYPNGYYMGGAANVAGLPLLPFDFLQVGQTYAVTVFAEGTFDYTWDGNAAVGGYRRYNTIEGLTVPECSPFPGGGATEGCFPGHPPFPGQVPEPASLLLLGTGLVGLVGTARRRLRK